MQAIINVTEDLFRYLFVIYNRENQFTHEGLYLLYQHLEMLEQDFTTPQSLNVIDLCMTYKEETKEQFITSRCLIVQEVRELELDEEGEVLEEETVDLEYEDMSQAQVDECIRDYLEDNDKYLVGFTDTTVLFY
jgi:hypothetical protein